MEASTMKAQTITTGEWESEVLGSDRPVLVDFWAEWCGPCRMVSPIVEEVASEKSEQLKVVKVNIDDEPEISRKYAIMSIPTLMLFKNGEMAKRWIGARGKAQLLSELSPYLA